MPLRFHSSGEEREEMICLCPLSHAMKSLRSKFADSQCQCAIGSGSFTTGSLIMHLKDHEKSCALHWVTLRHVSKYCGMDENKKDAGIPSSDDDSEIPAASGLTPVKKDIKDANSLGALKVPDEVNNFKSSSAKLMDELSSTLDLTVLKDMLPLFSD